MKGSNIDFYAKKTLENHTEVPKNNTWQRLSDELDDVEFRKKKNSFRVSVGMLMLGLFCSLQFTGDNTTTLTDSTIEKGSNLLSGSIKTNSEQDPIIVPVKQSPVINKKSTATVVANTKAENIKNSVGYEKGMTSVNQFHISKPSADKSEAFEEATLPIQKDVVSSVEQVTEADIELLLKRARTNIERERSLTEIRKSNAHNMLTQVERDIQQPVERRLYRDVKQGFVKLKTILAN